jgi:hypothetical protein
VDALFLFGKFKFGFGGHEPPLTNEHSQLTLIITINITQITALAHGRKH